MIFLLQLEKNYHIVCQWGPKSYNIRIRRYVKENYGYLLNQHGLFYANSNKRVRHFKSEKELIDFIGTTYYKPYDRM